MEKLKPEKALKSKRSFEKLKPEKSKNKSKIKIIKYQPVQKIVQAKDDKNWKDIRYQISKIDLKSKRQEKS